MSSRGIVAGGHRLTAEAGAEVLRAGGNAFDAACAALIMACVCEPMLASLGGGGYLTAHRVNGNVRVYDFFGHTPENQLSGAEVLPIHGDFGATTQEFHIGMGTAAVPGVVSGLFTINRQLGRLPFRRLIEPAVAAAKAGVSVTPLQSHIANILSPIVRFHDDLSQLFGGVQGFRAGDQQQMPELADTLAALADEGPGLFYRGTIARSIAAMAEQYGGHLNLSDLARYQTIVRRPLQRETLGAVLYTNPLPSCGGMLIAHSLGLAERRAKQDALSLVQLMAATNHARRQSRLQQQPTVSVDEFFADDALESALAQSAPLMRRGTTHISAADATGNIAALTVSNGEGNGYLIPNTGIHLNNFLGEEDLNPDGIGQWPPNQRMASMMAPTLIQQTDRWIALGSGGSNRLRTAITQVALGLLQDNQALVDAIERPRLHLENQRLSVEPGCAVDGLSELNFELEQWPRKDLFFGGVHGVIVDKQQLIGHADSRREGAVAVA